MAKTTSRPIPPKAPSGSGRTSPAVLFERYKKPALVVAAVAVAGIAALSARGKGTTAGPTYTGANQTAGSTGYTAAPGSAYDSTASDVYNAIQPQIEALQRAWEARQSEAPTPVPGPAPAPSSYEDGYYRRAGSQALFRWFNGVLDFITNPEYLALGTPKHTDLPQDDPLWNSPTVGYIPTGSLPGQTPAAPKPAPPAPAPTAPAPVLPAPARPIAAALPTPPRTTTPTKVR